MQSFEFPYSTVQMPLSLQMPLPGMQHFYPMEGVIFPAQGSPSFANPSQAVTESVQLPINVSSPLNGADGLAQQSQMAVAQPAPQAAEPLCPQEAPLRHLIIKLLFRTDADFPKKNSQEEANTDPHVEMAAILHSEGLQEKIQSVVQDLGLGTTSRTVGDLVMLDNLLTVELLFNAPKVSDKVAVESRKLPFKEVVEKIKNLKDEDAIFTQNANLISSKNSTRTSTRLYVQNIRPSERGIVICVNRSSTKDFRQLEQAVDKESKAQSSYLISLQDYANKEKQFYAARRNLQGLDPSTAPEQYKTALKILTGSEEGDFKDGCEYAGGLFLSKKSAATKAAKLHAALQNLSNIVNEKRAALAVATAHEIFYGQAYEKSRRVSYYLLRSLLTFVQLSRRAQLPFELSPPVRLLALMRLRINIGGRQTPREGVRDELQVLGLRRNGLLPSSSGVRATARSGHDGSRTRSPELVGGFQLHSLCYVLITSNKSLMSSPSLYYQITGRFGPAAISGSDPPGRVRRRRTGPGRRDRRPGSPAPPLPGSR
eukprot:753405-Hanusia_phi.AAC.1